MPIPIVNGDQTSIMVAQLVTSLHQMGKSATQTGVSLVASLPATDMYRVTGYMKKTQAATTSSTLGPITLSYTDGGDSTSLTATLALTTSAGAIATTNATNSATVTGIDSIVPFTFYGKAGTAVSFSITYASSGTTPMQYELHLHVEVV
jgi:hypothetical protein